MTVVYLLFISFAIAYFCGLFDNYKFADLSFPITDRVSIIEHLTKYKIKTKSYGNKPGKFQSFNKNINATKKGEVVHFQYEFPVSGKYSCTFQCILDPVKVSSEVDAYGIPFRAIKRIDNEHVMPNETLSSDQLTVLMNQGGWYFRSMQDWGMDYAQVIKNYRNFSNPIAHAIYEALRVKGEDTYYNRVQAALNFIQFIAYGIPDFDTEDWYYHEMAIPPESFILGYADCDSKSVFMASILSDLIPWENFILLACQVRSKNEKTNGGHMMIAVSGLGIEGEFIQFKGIQYLLLETTAPWIIGKTDWEHISVDKIYRLV